MEDELNDSNSSTNSSSSNQDVDSDSQDADRTEFNRSLATRHTYIPGDIQELRGCTILPESEKMLLPILIEDTVLFPFKTLPLSFEGNEIKFIENHLLKSNAIVVAAMDNIGCTAEIHSKSYNSVHEELTVTTVGRQRVKILKETLFKYPPISLRLLVGMVVAIPDDPLQEIPHDIFSCPDPLLRSAFSAIQFVRENNLDVSKQETKRLLKPYTRFKRSGTLTAFNRHTLRLFEEDELMQRAKSLLIEKIGQLPCELPNDFTSFTYKLAGSLPFINEVLLAILRIDSPHQRLRFIMKCLSNTSDLQCVTCESVMTNSKYIFSMSQEGPLTNYINPHGIVHDTLTVTDVLNTRLVGKPTSEYSWFPGYKWTTLYCAHCNQHLGWKFQSSKLIPQLFFGLTRKSLIWQIK